MRRILLVGVVTAAMPLLVPGLASAAGTPGVATGTADTPQGKLLVAAVPILGILLPLGHWEEGKPAVEQIAGYGDQSALGGNGATATLTPLGQAPTTVTKKVTLAAARTGTCTILTLTLDTLELKLLGLEVHLDKVVLTITGERHGGVLGSLFCSLAGAKVKAARQSAVSHLNAAIRRTGPVRPIGFTATVRAVTSAVGPTCPILNLVVGPLHLNLLGLVVDLNQVHLTINADPTGGVLGSLFCGLANTKIP